MRKEPLTTGQIAEYCHVTVRAVYKWIKLGKLKAYQTPGRHSRVEFEDFIYFLKKYDMPTPEEFKLASQKQKILVVDDDREMVNSIRRMLILENKYSLAVAYDGFTAGRKFMEFQPDLMILDIKMPGMDGYEVCSQIRSNPANKNVKILAVSGILGIEGGEKILSMGANDFMAKPFDNNELKKKIEKLLKEKTSKIIKGISTILLVASLLLSQTVAFAFDEYNESARSFKIRQENYETNGVLVSRPKSIDEKMLNVIRLNDIQNLKDYSQWLEDNITYVKDGAIDSWSKPVETLKRKRGDCEDFTLLTSAVVRLFGYKPKFIAFIQAKRPDKGHAICVFKKNGYYVWFDNATLKQTKTKTLEEFAQLILSEEDYSEMRELNVETKEWEVVYERS